MDIGSIYMEIDHKDSKWESILIGSVRKVAERKSGKAKNGEEAQFTRVNAHSEPLFNAACASAGTFRTEPSMTMPETGVSALYGVTVFRLILPP